MNFILSRDHLPWDIIKDMVSDWAKDIDDIIVPTIAHEVFLFKNTNRNFDDRDQFGRYLAFFEEIPIGFI